MRFRDYVNEASTRSLVNFPKEYLSETKLKAGERKKINAALQKKVLKETYFKSIPISEIDNVLRQFGVLLIQEDNTPWSGILAGGVKDTQMVHFNLGWMDDKFGEKQYRAIPNSVFTMTYFRMPSGKYEVIGYIS